MSDLLVQNAVNQSIDQIAKNHIDQKLESAKSAPNNGEVEKIAKDFEAVFISQMLSHMFAGIETDPLFGGGQSEKIYKGMMVEEYGKMMAQAGGIGLADELKTEILRLQGEQVNE